MKHHIPYETITPMDSVAVDDVKEHPSWNIIIIDQTKNNNMKQF